MYIFISEKENNTKIERFSFLSNINYNKYISDHFYVKIINQDNNSAEYKFYKRMFVYEIIIKNEKDKEKLNNLSNLNIYHFYNNHTIDSIINEIYKITHYDIPIITDKILYNLITDLILNNVYYNYKTFINKIIRIIDSGIIL